MYKVYNVGASTWYMKSVLSLDKWFTATARARQGHPPQLFLELSCLMLWKKIMERLAKAAEILTICGLSMTQML